MVARPTIGVEVWYELQELALAMKRAGVKADASELCELGARVLIATVKAGRLPDELGYLLERQDREALEKLLAMLRAVNEEPSFEVA